MDESVAPQTTCVDETTPEHNRRVNVEVCANILKQCTSHVARKMLVGALPPDSVNCHPSHIWGPGFYSQKTSSSAVAKRPRDASCLSVVSFISTKRRVIFYC